jgi:hypothetical protein
MIPAIQREALAVLAELCDLSDDDVRLGQLLALIGLLGEDQTERNLWNIEDEEFLATLNLHKSQLLARLPESEQRAFRSRGPSLLPARPETSPAATPATEVGP